MQKNKPKRVAVVAKPLDVRGRRTADPRRTAVLVVNESTIRLTPEELAVVIAQGQAAYPEVVRLAAEAGLDARGVPGGVEATPLTQSDFRVHPPVSEPAPAFEVGDPRQ